MLLHYEARPSRARFYFNGILIKFVIDYEVS